MTTLRRFLADRTGQTAIEYALIAVLCSAMIIASVGPMGQSVVGMLEGLQAAFAEDAAD